MEPSGFEARLFLCIAVVLLWSTTLNAQDTVTGVWSTTVENDKWGRGSDSNYTHGTRINYRTEESPHWLKRIAGGLGCRRCTNPTSTEYEFGQEIYTPYGIYLPGLIEHDRPYAGWAYAKATLQTEHPTRNPRLGEFSKMGFQIGIVGPASLAEESQKLLHNLKGLDEPLGWDHQLNNEPGLVISYSKGIRYRLSPDSETRLNHVISPYITGEIGNVSTYVGIGTEFTSHLMSANRKRDTDEGWQFFANVEGRAVARNLFLDGNTWSSSHSVEKKPLVAVATVGLQYRAERFGFRFARFFRSKEFDGQVLPSQYGSLTFWLSP